MSLRHTAKLVLSVLVLTLVGLQLVGAQDSPMTVQNDATATSNAVILRSGPGTKYTDLASFHIDFTMPITGRNDFPSTLTCDGPLIQDLTMWVRVQFNEIEGWVWVCHPNLTFSGDVSTLPVVTASNPMLKDDPRFPISDLKGDDVKPSNTVSTVQVNYSTALLRETPNISSNVIGSIDFGKLVYVTGRTEQSGWVKVSYLGHTGWIASHLLLLNNDWETTTPVTQ